MHVHCRAPYDSIFTEEGICLRKRAEQLPDLDAQGSAGADPYAPHQHQSLAAATCPGFQLPGMSPITFMPCPMMHQDASYAQ